MSSRPCKPRKPCLSRLFRIHSSLMRPSTSSREAHLFMILTVSSLPSLPTGSVMGDFLPNKHYIMPKQLGGIFSGIHPKIPLIHADMSQQPHLGGDEGAPSLKPPLLHEHIRDKCDKCDKQQKANSVLNSSHQKVLGRVM